MLIVVNPMDNMILMLVFLHQMLMYNPSRDAHFFQIENRRIPLMVAAISTSCWHPF